jgi:hypothetical protein
MALTDFCDVFFSLSEDAINKFALHIARQRPSLFNYGTSYFFYKPHRMCREIPLAPKLPNPPRVTQQGLLSVPGTPFGLEYCAQLSELRIDFHPDNAINFPHEIGGLNAQQLGFSLKFCIGLGAQTDAYLSQLGDKVASSSTPSRFAASSSDLSPLDDKPIPLIPVPVDEDMIFCVCLEVFFVAHFEVVPDGMGQRLAARLESLEIVDIAPPGLERIVEHVVKATLILGFLPHFRIALEQYVFSIGEFGNLYVGLVPQSADVPHNPDVSRDHFSLFATVS